MMDMGKESARLRRKVGKWLGEWVETPELVRTFHDEPPLVYKAYLRDEDDDALLSGRSGRLHTWHLIHFEHHALNQGEYRWNELALATRYANACVQLESAFEHGSILVSWAPLYLSLNVLMGWQDQARTIGDTLLAGLDTKLLDLHHTDRHVKGEAYRHFWFVMQLYASYIGKQIDLSQYSCPQDMTLYAAALANWRTDDLDAVHEWVCAMADFHIEHAYFSDDEVNEFDDEDRMLFPYEILFFLRLREWSGLQNPESFDHPLMRQPLAKLPEPVPLPQPDIPLLEQVIAKFRQEHPGSFA